VASTLHKCLKHYQGGERKINNNVKPFKKAESHFADARFFEEDNTPTETMPSTITFTGKGGTKNALQVLKKDIFIHLLKKEKSKSGDTSSSVKQVDIKSRYLFSVSTCSPGVHP